MFNGYEIRASIDEQEEEILLVAAGQYSLQQSTMGKGQRYPSESRVFIDDPTGITIRQVTSAAAIHHHPISGKSEIILRRATIAHLQFCPDDPHTHPTFSPDNRFVLFTSDKTGFAQIYEAQVPV